MDTKELEKLFNEDELSFPKLKDYPIVKPNGRDGSFFLIKNGEKEILGDELSLVVFAVRKSLTSFSKKSYRFSTQFDNLNDNVVLFEKVLSTDILTKIADGNPDKLRANYPDLKTVYHIYSYLDDKIVRFDIKGASLSNWFDFLREKNNRLINEYLIVKQEKVDDGQIPYFVCVFEEGEDASDFWNAKKVNEVKSFYDTISKIKKFGGGKTGFAETIAKDSSFDDDFGGLNESIVEIE